MNIIEMRIAMDTDRYVLSITIRSEAGEVTREIKGDGGISAALLKSEEFIASFRHKWDACD